MANQVWLWFTDLHAGRQHGMAGAQALTNQEMLAYFTLEGVKPLGWELQAVRMLDRVALEARKETD